MNPLATMGISFLHRKLQGVALLLVFVSFSFKGAFKDVRSPTDAVIGEEYLVSVAPDSARSHLRTPTNAEKRSLLGESLSPEGENADVPMTATHAPPDDELPAAATTTARNEIAAEKKVYPIHKDIKFTSKLMYYDEEALARDKAMYESGDERILKTMNHLIQLGDEALSQGPWSVVDKLTESPSGDAHDYYTPDPFFWPHKHPSTGKIVEKAPYVKRRIRVPGTQLYDDGSEAFDRTSLVSMQWNTTVLALSYYVTGNSEYGEVAARNIRTWFLNSNTRMNPNLKYAQVRGNHGTVNQAGIVELRDIYFLLDAIRILEAGGFLSQIEQLGLKLWFTKFLEWTERANLRDNYGIAFDIQAFAIRAYITNPTGLEQFKNPDILVKAMIEVQARMREMISPEDGSMPHELISGHCEHTQMHALQGLSALSRLGNAVGRSLWNPKPYTGGAATLCHAAQYSIPYYRDRTICNGNLKMEDERRWLPLLQESRSNCPKLNENATTWNIWQDPSIGPPGRTAYEMPSIFSPEYAIAPFWNLGLPQADRDWPVALTVEQRLTSVGNSPMASKVRATAFDRAKKSKSPKPTNKPLGAPTTVSAQKLDNRQQAAQPVSAPMSLDNRKQQPEQLASTPTLDNRKQQPKRLASTPNLDNRKQQPEQLLANEEAEKPEKA